MQVESGCGQVDGAGLTVHQSVTRSSQTPCSGVGSESEWKRRHTSHSG